MPCQQGTGLGCPASLLAGFASKLETEEQRLERKQNECDVLEALGDYKCDAGMSVETVPAVVNIRRTIDSTQVVYWVVGGCGVECGQEDEC